MKRLFTVFLLLLLVLPKVFTADTIEEFLEELPLTNIRILEKESFYGKIFEIMFEQPVDHNDPSKGKFSQRLYLSHTDR